MAAISGSWGLETQCWLYCVVIWKTRSCSRPPRENRVQQQPGIRATPTEAESLQICSSQCVFFSSVVSLTQLFLPTSSCSSHCLFSTSCSNKTGARQVSHGEILRADLSSTPQEEYAVTPLPAASQGTWRGETNLPSPAACLTPRGLSCPLCDAAEICPVPQSFSSCPASPAASASVSHSATKEIAPCVSLQLWLFFF